MRSLLYIAALFVALAVTGCASTNANTGRVSSSSTRCADCGIVTRIETEEATSSVPSLTGAILGGVVGAVAGHEISAHTGGSKGNQNISAAAGAAAGAIAGNTIQNRVTGDSYYIHVRMDDGRTLVVRQNDLGGVRENAYVRVVRNKVVLR